MPLLSKEEKHDISSFPDTFPAWTVGMHRFKEATPEDRRNRCRKLRLLVVLIDKNRSQKEKYGKIREKMLINYCLSNIFAA